MKLKSINIVKQLLVQKNKKFFILVMGVLYLTSCATTHPGKMANVSGQSEPLPLEISAELIDTHMKNDPFQLINLTFENKKDDWMRIKSAELVIDDPVASRISVVVGKDLKEWANGMDLRMRKENHNSRMAMMGMNTLGAAAIVAGSQSNNPELMLLGGATAIASETWALSEVIYQSINNANGIETVPENHLYNPFSVPGKMFIRKWIVLNKPSNHSINNLVFKLETIDGKSSIYEVHL